MTVYYCVLSVIPHLHVCYMYIGVDNVDYNRYPDEAMQKHWIRLYLEEKVALRGKLYHSAFCDYCDMYMVCLCVKVMDSMPRPSVMTLYISCTEL